MTDKDSWMKLGINKISLAILVALLFKVNCISDRCNYGVLHGCWQFIYMEKYFELCVNDNSCLLFFENLELINTVCNLISANKGKECILSASRLENEIFMFRFRDDLNGKLRLEDLNDNNKIIEYYYIGEFPNYTTPYEYEIYKEGIHLRMIKFMAINSVD